MLTIKVVDVCPEGSRVSYRLAYSKDIQKYLLKDSFFVHYAPPFEAGSIDQSILVIPLVATIAPVAWAVGADVEVDSLDDTFLQSLCAVREVLTKWYPCFSSSGSIKVRTTVRNRFEGTRTALLFSGGLDSLTSYATHRDDKPDLISLWSCSPRLHEDEQWADVLRCGRWLVERDGITHCLIRSDLTYYNERLLNFKFGFYSWFAQVAHGLLLLGACAPITPTRGIRRVLIGSSNPHDRLEPWGSHPSIDNNVSWADVVAVHDNVEMSRQQKMRYMCAKSPQYLPRMKVCHMASPNCGQCEKCFRTIVGLCEEGVNPRDCGFRVDQKTLARVRKSILAGKMPRSSSEMIEWTDLQRHLRAMTRPDIIGSVEFFNWFRSYDFSQHRVSKRRTSLWDARLELLRLYHSMRSKPITRQHLEFLHYLVVCYLHTNASRVRRASASILRLNRATR